MQRKPIILIMTSRDEFDNVSQKLAAAVRAIGTHNVVVMSDDKYGAVAKRSTLERLMDSRNEYQYLLEKKDRGVLRDKLRLKKFSKRVRRIGNMLKRFHPEYILCMTPYAHHCASEAKRKLKFTTKIIYLMQSFTLPKRGVGEDTDVFIVENQDVKSEMVRLGIRPKNIMTMGLPFDAVPKTEEEIATAKQELGLPRSKTIFVNMRSKKDLMSVMSLLLDQGHIATIAVNCDNQKLKQEIGNMALTASVPIIFVPAKEKAEDFLAVCDIAVTDFDPSVIYKSFKLGIPVILFTRDEHAQQDIQYLVTRGLALRAREDMDIVGLVYKLLQTELASDLAANGKKWVEFSSLENIANFLATYIAL